MVNWLPPVVAVVSQSAFLMSENLYNLLEMLISFLNIFSIYSHRKEMPICMDPQRHLISKNSYLSSYLWKLHIELLKGSIIEPNDQDSYVTS